MKKNAKSGLFGVACLLLSQLGFSQGNASTDYKRIDVMHETKAWSFGVNVGSANVNTIDNSVFSFGVFGDYFNSPNFSLGVSLDYWNDSFNTAPDRRVEVNDLVLGGNGKFMFPDFTTGLRPFVLAGLALHRFQIDTVERDPNADPITDKFSEYDRNLADVSGELGADFGAGIFYRVQPSMDLIAELRYRRILDRSVDLDQTNYSVALSYVM